MMRAVFYLICGAGLALVAAVFAFWPPVAWLLVVLVPYALVGLYDIFISPNNVLTNYPVIGHLRYMLEFISPEIHQYFIEGPHDGRPYNREQRQMACVRAAGGSNTMPFGTQFDLMDNGMEFAHHSLAAQTVPDSALRITVGGAACTTPYAASRLNISAMSFGALSANAIRALNRGARLGGFCHNTGEGGLSPHHLEQGGDLCWQIGTGYFGCRTRTGNFDPDAFRDKAAHPQVKLIEIKLSQGAKPSHGGVLPAAKVSAEIAGIRMITQGEDCLSPAGHSAFDGPTGLVEFVAQLRELTGGKPIGFKLCIGRREEFFSIVKAMLGTGITPDFITVDGAEGGTGAAPFEFSDRLGLPGIEGLNFVHNALVGVRLRDAMRLVASAKVLSAFDIVARLALGADLVNMARPMMFALGCIQARRCDTNTCPSGVATQDPRRGNAVEVRLRGEHVQNFHATTLGTFRELLGAMGHTDPGALRPADIMRRRDDAGAVNYAEIFPQLAAGALLHEPVTGAYARDWQRASAHRFQPAAT